MPFVSLPTRQTLLSSTRLSSGHSVSFSVLTDFPPVFPLHVAQILFLLLLGGFSCQFPQPSLRGEPRKRLYLSLQFQYPEKCPLQSRCRINAFLLIFLQERAELIGKFQGVVWIFSTLHGQLTGGRVLRQVVALTAHKWMMWAETPSLCKNPGQLMAGSKVQFTGAVGWLQVFAERAPQGKQI